MGGLFTLLFSKISGVVEWVGKLFKAVFKAASDLLSDIACWCFEQVMTIVEGAVSVLDFSAITPHLSTWAGVPDVVIEVLAASGVGAALTMVAGAIAVRVGLQLIPFTRLGS